MSESLGTRAGDGGSERRLGQVVVIAICVVGLVVAGAIAPTVGSPFQDGPRVNASQVGGVNGTGAGQNASGLTPQSQSSATPSVPEGATQAGIGSMDEATVGGAGALGSLREQSGNVQFVVQSPRNTYYRVGSYQSFDGVSWSRGSETTAFSGAVPGASPPGRELTMQVTLNAPARAVPVPWRPQRVEGPVPLAIRETGGIVPRQSLAPNQSFTVTAVEPTRDPSVLQESGYVYPQAIREQYVRVDSNVSERVASLTDRVTEGSSSPYAEAVAIRDWLESNKEYSLNVSTDTSRPVTRQFLFEMDAGYCQQFASSMAVMLRTQGIPARYVVGYAPGTKVDDSTYAVTSAQAHAWVEVYFEDVGWVRFDPTPAAGRQSADEAVTSSENVTSTYQESSLRSQVNASEFEPNASQTGGDTDGEAGDGTATGGDGTTAGGDGTGSGDGTTATGPGDGTETSTDTGTEDGTTEGTDEQDDGEQDDGTDDEDDGTDDEDDGTDDGSDQPPLEVSLNERPVPGSMVTVTVTRGGEPVLGAEVYFNDEYVGRTDYEGEVRAEVPYTSNLSVRVVGPDESTRSKSTASAVGHAGTQLWRSPGDGVARLENAPPREERASSAIQTASLHPSAAFAESGALQQSDAVAESGSLQQSDAVAESGPLQQSDAVAHSSGVPEEAFAVGPDNETTREFEVSTEMSFSTPSVPAPGQQGVLQVSIEGEPVEDAVVFVAGDRVGRTNDSGRVAVRFPSGRSNATVRVQRGEISDSTTIALATTVDVSLDGPRPVPGTTTTVNATFDGEPFADASVAIDGTVVATTDDAGRARVPVPLESGSSVTVTVDRGVYSGSVTAPVASNASIVLDRPASPGESTTVTVAVRNVSIPDATVRVAGERVGTTNEAGRTTIDIPASATGELNVSTTAGSISGTRTIDLFEPNVSVTPAYVVAFPGAPAAVNVTDEGVPLSNATVSFGSGERARSVGETGADGRVDVVLPFANAVTVSASTLGASSETRLDWLFLNLFGVLAVVVVGAVVAVGSISESGRVGAFARRVRRLAVRLGRGTVERLFAVANWIDDALGRLPAVPGRVRELLERFVAAPVRTLRALGTTVRALAVTVWARVLAAFTGVVGWLRGVGSTVQREDSGGTSSQAASETPAGAGEGSRSGLAVVRAAWRALVAVVSPSSIRTRTPGEIAREGREMGLPGDAVQTVTDAYRRAMYGGEEPSPADVSAVTSARSEFESTTAGREPDGDLPAGEPDGDPPAGEPDGDPPAGEPDDPAPPDDADPPGERGAGTNDGSNVDPPRSGAGDEPSSSEGAD